MNLKQAILEYIDKFKVVDFILLIDALDESFPTATTGEKYQALSELVQSKSVVRYEYQVDGRPERRSFYMSADTKVCL